jgi:hypothetical protein
MTKIPSIISIRDSIDVPSMCVVASLILINLDIVMIARNCAIKLGWLYNRRIFVPKVYVLGNIIRIQATFSTRGTIILTKASAPSTQHRSLIQYLQIVEFNSSQIMIHR